MKNICLIIEYDGSHLNGFQIQPHKHVITVQGELEKVLTNILGEEIKTIGAGRTDAGVSADNQVINFQTESTLEPEKLKFILNTKLPKEISVKKSFEVPLDFHARYSAIKRTYRYRLLNSPTRSALRRNHVSMYPKKLDFELMKQAWENLSGKYDFSAFCKKGSDRVYMECNIYNTYCEKHEDELVFYITSDTFLRGMVRLLVGTLIRIGEQKLNPEDLILAAKTQDRSKVGFCSPPTGLSLIKIEYPKELLINEN